LMTRSGCAFSANRFLAVRRAACSHHLEQKLRLAYCIDRDG
jgi:hypothetical protein